MIGVSWLIRNATRKKRNHGRNQIEPGMRSLGKYAQAAGGNTDYDLQCGDSDRGQDGIASYGTLFRASKLA